MLSIPHQVHVAIHAFTRISCIPLRLFIPGASNAALNTPKNIADFTHSLYVLSPRTLPSFGDFPYSALLIRLVDS
jgi:hypothetical protein